MTIIYGLENAVLYLSRSSCRGPSWPIDSLISLLVPCQAFVLI